MKPTRSILAGAMALVLAAGPAALADRSPIGKKAPELALHQWIRGVPKKLEQLKGQVVILEFWATWCKPCREVVPHLIDLDRRFRLRPIATRRKPRLAILTVSNENPARIMRFVRQNLFWVQGPRGRRFRSPITYDVARDRRNETFRRYGVRTVPWTVLIDKKGIVRWSGRAALFPVALFRNLLAEGMRGR